MTFEPLRNPKYARKSVRKSKPRMELNTHVANVMMKDNIVTFVVYMHTTKDQVVASLKKLYGVDVAEVRFFSTLSTKVGTKWAYVQLTDGYDAREIAKKIEIECLRSGSPVRQSAVTERKHAP